MTLSIIDEAIQMHCGVGLSQDSPSSIRYGDQRAIRYADGPDAVHRMVIRRRELKKYELALTGSIVTRQLIGLEGVTVQDSDD